MWASVTALDVLSKRKTPWSTVTLIAPAVLPFVTVSRATPTTMSDVDARAGRR
jgi:hypothetical protein